MVDLDLCCFVGSVGFRKNEVKRFKIVNSFVSCRVGRLESTEKIAKSINKLSNGKTVTYYGKAVRMLTARDLFYSTSAAVRYARKYETYVLQR
jgi:hypothetical protein